MKKLIPAIYEIAAEHKIERFKTFFHFEPYYVFVSIRYAPPYLPSDCEISIGIRNSLVEQAEVMAVEKLCDENYEILEDLREKILGGIQRVVVLCKNSMPIEEYLKKEELIEAHRRAVMEDYCLRYGLDDKQRTALHMFFSPNCIVTGLTKEEVSLCLEHYPLRVKQKELYPVMALPFLHPKLMERCDEELPRGEGLRLAIEAILADVETKQPICKS